MTYVNANVRFLNSSMFQIGRDPEDWTLSTTERSAIGPRLSSDKVFDVIGRLLENISLRDYMRAALTGDGEQSDLQELERAVSESAVNDLAEGQAKVYGAAGEIAPRLPGMRRELDRERYLHLLPAYVRLFVESAATRLGIGIQGDLDGVFSLEPAPPGALDPLLPALEGYPSEVRKRLRVRRPHAGEPCIWLHPGEPVFDALCSHVIEAFSRHARRGAIFIDPHADEAGLWHLAVASVEERTSGNVLSGEPSALAHQCSRHTLERRLVALRQAGDPKCIRPRTAAISNASAATCGLSPDRNWRGSSAAAV